VKDTRNALSFLASRAESIPAHRRGGSQSFGARSRSTPRASTAGRSLHLVGGWGDGAKKFRRQHRPRPGLGEVLAMMKEGKRRQARGQADDGAALRIVPIPPRLRGNLAPARSWNSLSRSSRACSGSRHEVVGRIAPAAAAPASLGERLGDAHRAAVELFSRAGNPPTST